MQDFKFLKTGDKIGVCAPSMGCEGDVYVKRCENAVKKLNKLGHEVVFTKNCFGNTFARSSISKTRAQEFEQLFLNDDIAGIISMAGGEYEMEILPYINFGAIKKAKNKFFQGFSDNTCLTFLLTTLCDKMSVYGTNFCGFAMNKWHKSIAQNYEFLIGKKVEQISYDKYELDNSRKEPGHYFDSYNLKVKTHPIVLSEEKEVSVSGRLIGGCLDVLSVLCGTKFDKVKEFCKKYKEDGIIWYLESCDLSVLSQSRALWQLKNAGWFDNAKAILIGRPLHKESVFDVTYLQANYEQLADLNIPVVIDLDFGHTNPQWFLINGAKTKFEMKGKKAKINFKIN